VKKGREALQHVSGEKKREEGPDLPRRRGKHLERKERKLVHQNSQEKKEGGVLHRTFGDVLLGKRKGDLLRINRGGALRGENP